MKENQHYKNIAVVLLVLLVVSFIWKNIIMFWIVAAVGVLLLSYEPLAKLFSKYWMALGKFLGDINSKIILSFFFLFILTPMALLKRVISSKYDCKSSTWITVEQAPDFTKPW
jgi:hypothetical protein